MKAVLDATGGQGADVVVTTSGSVEAHEQAVDMVAHRGYINLFGGLGKDARPDEPVLEQDPLPGVFPHRFSWVCTQAAQDRSETIGEWARPCKASHYALLSLCPNSRKPSLLWNHARA